VRLQSAPQMYTYAEFSQRCRFVSMFQNVSGNISEFTDETCHVIHEACVGKSNTPTGCIPRQIVWHL